MLLHSLSIPITTEAIESNRRLSVSSEGMAESDCNNVVFIDTNLHTHLALLVSHLDTVSNLKKRILLEHPLCFPKIGQIQIHAVKVKRKGYFYHLSDSMLVRSAFNGVSKSWFLSVDASAFGEHEQNQQLLSSGSPNKAACLAIANHAFLGPVDNAVNFPSKGMSGLNCFQLPELENKQDEKEEVPFVSPCVSDHTGKEAAKNLTTGLKSSGDNGVGISLAGSVPETEDHHCVNNEIPSLNIECEVDKSSKGTTKDNCNVCDDDPSIYVPSLKKKRKSKRKKEETVQDDTSKENIASVDNPFSVPSEMVSNFQAPILENKQDEKEEIHSVSPSVSKHTGKEVVQNLEKDVKSSGNNDPGIPLPGSIPETEDHCYVNDELTSLHIECKVDRSSKGTTKDDCNVCEEVPSISVPSVKKKRKSKKKKEDTMRGDTSKENISSVDNPLSVPSKEVSSFNNFQAPQLENKRDEKEGSHFASPCVSEHTGKKAVKSSGNNDSGIPLPASIPETEDHCYVNDELPSLHIECKVDQSSKGTTKNDGNVCEENPSISVPSVKKKRKSKRKIEDVLHDDTSKVNIASVDNPLCVPANRVCSVINFQAPQLGNKQDEKEESHFASPCVSEHTGKNVVKDLGKGVKSSGNDDTGIPLPASIPETEDHSYVNDDLPSLHIECKVDQSSKGTTKDDCDVREDDPSISVPSVKRKRKSKKKKEGILQDDTSKENIASVDNPLSVPSKEVSSFNNFQAPQLENKQDEKEDTDIDDESMKEASKAGPAGNKKHGKRKRSLTHDSKEMLVVETTSRKDEAQKSDEARKESKESKDQFEFNNDKSRSDVQDKHNKVPEDGSDTRSPAKKKKGKEKSGDKSLSKKNLSMISDFNVEDASHHFLEDQQKIKNSSDEQSAEHFNDADPLRSSVLDRSKGKKISSNPHETPVVTSSRKDYEADPSGIREGVEEEISVKGLFFKGDTTQEMGENRKAPDLLAFCMNKTTIDNMDVGTDACKEGIGSKIHPSDVNEPKELTEDTVNIVIDHCHKSEAGQSEGTEEGREVSPQNDPKPMLLEECPPSIQDNTGAIIKELNVTSKVVDENGMAEPVKSEKKKRGIRKAKDLGGGPSLRDGIGPVDASDNETFIVQSLRATNCDPASGNTEIEENLKNMQQEEMKGTVLSDTDKQDDFSADNAGSLEQIKTEANAKHADEHVDKKQRKKSNNKETSTSKSISNRDVSSLGENRKPHAIASGESMDLKKRRDRIPISNSKLDGSKKKVQNKAGKASGHNVVGVVSNTQQKKSLLAGAIFKDDSGTSEDEVENSDASTRTPSDNSLLSDFSDGDSNASLGSQQTGLHGGKRLENGGRSALKASLSGTKGMAIDHVLRSSRRYKKAKINASQTESQVEFVPDSLAD